MVGGLGMTHRRRSAAARAESVLLCRVIGIWNHTWNLHGFGKVDLLSGRRAPFKTLTCRQGWAPRKGLRHISTRHRGAAQQGREARVPSNFPEGPSSISRQS